MNKKLLPSCPYCGNKPTFLDAWLMKNKGEYFCPHCKNISDIVFKDKLYINFIKVSATSIIIMLISLFMPWKLLFLEVTAVVLPYIAFYLSVPGLMMFEPMKRPRE